jgi:hypothetical protein
MMPSTACVMPAPPRSRHRDPVEKLCQFCGAFGTGVVGGVSML